MKVIELHEVSKVFEGRSVLNRITFSVEEGEVFGLLGPNGAGKTTTMRIILGLLRPTSGEAWVKGTDLGTDDEARRSVGVLMENDGLYDRISAHQNLDYYARLYGVRDREARIAQLLEQFGLSDRRDDKVFTFSKGMRRKLGIARAIVHDPDVLLLDEPTSGLDPEAQKMVREVLLDLSQHEHITVLLSSHNLDEVQRVCNRVAVIKSGWLRACDSVENLRSAGRGYGVVIEVATLEQAIKAEGLVRSHPSVITASRSGKLISIVLSDECVSPLVTHLALAGIPLEEVRRAARSLEDVYIDLVKEGSA